MGQLCQTLLVLLLACHRCSAPLAEYNYDQKRLEALRQLRYLVLSGLEETQRESADVDRREVGTAAGAPASLDDIVAGAKMLSKGLEAEYASSPRPRITTITTVAVFTTTSEGLNGTVTRAGIFTALWFQHQFHRMLNVLPLAAWIAIFVAAVLIILALLLLCIVCYRCKAKGNTQWSRLEDQPQTLRYEDLDIVGKKQPPYGIINFSLEYDVSTCQLIVTVYSCTSLPKDLKDLDPYIVINISPDIPLGAGSGGINRQKPPVQSSNGIPTERSRVVRGSNNPAFNYTRVFKIKDRRQLKHKIITLEVYDWDFGTRHRMVARRVLDLLKFGERLDNILGRMVEYSEKLKPGINQEATGPGDICLSLCYSSQEKHLWVNVIECKGVFIQKMEKPDLETMPNSYVKLSISMDGSAKRMKQYTDTIKESRNPYFNKQFVFKLDSQQVKVASLRVTLVHRTETLRIKRIVGVLTLSLIAEKDSIALLHWREVLLNFDRPSSRWHTLITPEVERKLAERMAAAERKKQQELAEENDSSATATVASHARKK